MVLRGDSGYMIEKRLANDNEMFKEENSFPFAFVINRTDSLLSDMQSINAFIKACELSVSTH